MSDRRFTFSPEARLRKRYEFNSVYRMGCKQVTPHFLLLTSEGKTHISRLGITASRKVGNSVVRNRVKRIVREYFRLNSKRFKQPTDVSVIARQGAGQMSSQALWSELETLFR